MSAYGDLTARGVEGIVLEAFGVGNMPDTKSDGWMTWLTKQRKKSGANGRQLQVDPECDTKAPRILLQFPMRLELNNSLIHT